MYAWFTPNELCPLLAVLKLNSELAHNSSLDSYAVDKKNIYLEYITFTYTSLGVNVPI